MAHHRSNRSIKPRKKATGPKREGQPLFPALAGIHSFLETYGTVEFAKSFLFETEYTWVVAAICFVAELFINSAIILARPYTEIDWKAYMDEVEGFLNGTLDYAELKGDTGPLVYPAGFVYFFSFLYWITNNGTNIYRAQWIFGFFYMILTYQVYRLYCQSKKVPPYVILFLTFTSYRIHSIFVLRLFNDPVAIIFLYMSINCFIDGRWTFGSLYYSFAVSIKMNVLLYAPALLCVYLTQLSLFDTIIQLAVCGTLQLFLAMPFLLVNPWSYMSRSFDLGRVFLYEWTVNWKFVPEEIFTSKPFHLSLLAVHLITICLFVPSWIRYLRSHYKLKIIEQTTENSEDLGIRAQLILTPLFICNFIGIIFSRSLHFQFYVWYYHTLPYLLWSTKLPTRVKLAIFGLIELCWNVFPANPMSSWSLFISHSILLAGLWMYARPSKDINITYKNR